MGLFMLFVSAFFSVHPAAEAMMVTKMIIATIFKIFFISFPRKSSVIEKFYFSGIAKQFYFRENILSKIFKQYSTYFNFVGSRIQK